MNYADAGVSLERADKAMAGIKSHVKSTFNKNVLGDIGNFGGLFALDNLGMKDPILVSSVDGVGTKLKIDFDMGTHELPGQDIVNHCVDDILVQGAKPLFFLDYVGTGRLQDGVMEGLVSGMAKACRENGTVLIGGETAEMPGFYQDGEYDISGTIVGVVDRDELIDGSTIKAGTVVLGLASSGLHTNGYSLARKALLEVGGFKLEDTPEGFDKNLGLTLAEPHRSYLNSIYPLVKEKKLQGLVHVTGSGFQGNIPRVLPEGVDVIIDRTAWEVPPVFKLIQKTGDVEKDEMYNTFNMGVGLLAFVEASDVEYIKTKLEAAGEKVCVCGEVVAGNKSVSFKD
ncbi:MAG: phosphoribosylformylglycinamidine cyclo-ligase [Fibrobacterales bacterium]